MSTAAHSSDSTPAQRTRSGWRRRIDRAVNGVVLLCATWTLLVASDWILRWLFSSTPTQTEASNELAGHAMLGGILLVTGLAAFTLAMKRTPELDGSGLRPEHPRRVDRRRSDALASGDRSQEIA